MGLLGCLEYFVQHFPINLTDDNFLAKTNDVHVYWQYCAPDALNLHNHKSVLQRYLKQGSNVMEATKVIAVPLTVEAWSGVSAKGLGSQPCWPC